VEIAVTETVAFWHVCKQYHKMPRASILDCLPYVAAARLAEDVPEDWARLLEIAHA
jgi:hypothetical protein